MCHHQMRSANTNAKIFQGKESPWTQRIRKDFHLREEEHDQGHKEGRSHMSKGERRERPDGGHELQQRVGIRNTKTNVLMPRTEYPLGYCLVLGTRAKQGHQGLACIYP